MYVSVFYENKTPVDPNETLDKAEITSRDLPRNDGMAEVQVKMDGENTACFITLLSEMVHYLSDSCKAYSHSSTKGRINCID